MIVSRLVVSQVQIYLFTGNKVDPDELEPEFIATTSTTITTSTTTTATTSTTEFIDESTDKKPMMLRYIILFLRKLILNKS